MALDYAFGTIQWLSSNAVATTHTVSGLSFQPKALRFYTSGIQSASDVATTAANLQRGLGFATSPSDRRCVASFDDDGEATILCGAGYFDNAVVAVLDGSTTVAGLLDLTSITSDGFVLTVDDQSPQNVTVIWEAWGGADITDVAIGEIAEPASTGDVDYTVTGSFQPSVVMFGGSQVTGSAPLAAATDAGFCMGFASSGSSSNNVVFAGNCVDGGADTLTHSYGLAGECIAMMTVGTGALNARATMTQFNADGFRLNWIARGSTGRKYIYLAINGGTWAAGGMTIAGTALGSTSSVTGLPFQPAGLLFFGTRKVQSTAGTSTTQYLFGCGSVASTTSRVSTGHLILTAQASSNVLTAIEYDQIFGDYSIPGRSVDLSSFNADGFTVIREVTAESTANLWYGYLAFATAVASSSLSPSSSASPSSSTSPSSSSSSSLSPSSSTSPSSSSSASQSPSSSLSPSSSESLSQSPSASESLSTSPSSSESSSTSPSASISPSSSESGSTSPSSSVSPSGSTSPSISPSSSESSSESPSESSSASASVSPSSSPSPSAGGTAILYRWNGTIWDPTVIQVYTSGSFSPSIHYWWDGDSWEIVN